MPIDFVINDPLLEETPHGRFLLAVGQAVAELAPLEITSVRTAGTVLDVNVGEPTVWVMPAAERPMGPPFGGFQAGRFNIVFGSLVWVTASRSDKRQLPTGWHLLKRQEISRRFDGQTAAAAFVHRGDECFMTGVERGVLLDRQAAELGYDASSLVVLGGYHGDQ